MPFLNISTYGDIPVELNSAQRTVHEVGDRSRAFDGTMHDSVRARKRQWRLRTMRVPRATGNSIVTALQGTPPLSCSGDLLGATINCLAEIVSIEHPKHATGEHQIIEFILHER